MKGVKQAAKAAGGRGETFHYAVELHVYNRVLSRLSMGQKDRDDRT